MPTDQMFLQFSKFKWCSIKKSEEGLTILEYSKLKRIIEAFKIIHPIIVEVVDAKVVIKSLNISKEHVIILKKWCKLFSKIIDLGCVKVFKYLDAFFFNEVLPGYEEPSSHIQKTFGVCGHISYAIEITNKREIASIYTYCEQCNIWGLNEKCNIDVKIDFESNDFFIGPKRMIEYAASKYVQYEIPEILVSQLFPSCFPRKLPETKWKLFATTTKKGSTFFHQNCFFEKDVVMKEVSAFLRETPSIPEHLLGCGQLWLFTDHLKSDIKIRGLLRDIDATARTGDKKFCDIACDPNKREVRNVLLSTMGHYSLYKYEI